MSGSKIYEVAIMKLLLVLLPAALAKDNGLARTPPMGWSSWK
jgi:hypothetical protein